VELESGEFKSLPAIEFCPNEAVNSLFYREPSTNLALIAEVKEHLAKVEDRVGADKEIVKCNTRLPSEFQLKQ